MYKIQINKSTTEPLNKNERIEDGQVFKYYSSKSKAIDYCYKTKTSNYYKEQQDGTYKRVDIKTLQEDVFVYVIYELETTSTDEYKLGLQRTFYDIKYSLLNKQDYYTLEEIKDTLQTDRQDLSKFVVTSIEEIEDKLSNNMLHLINDKYLIFKEYETLESEEI